MSAPKPRVPVPAIALNQRDAAAALGMGPDHFRTHVAPDLRAIRSGSLTLFSVRELERWALEHAEHVLGDTA